MAPKGRGWHTMCVQAGNFLLMDLDIKFGPIRVRTAEISPIYRKPRCDDENPRIYIKGGKLGRGQDPIPTNFQPPNPRFCLPHGPHLHGGGLPRSHEGRGLRGGAPPWNRRRRRSPLRHRRCRRRPAPLAAPLCRLHRHLHHHLLLVFSGSSSHKPLYRPM